MALKLLETNAATPLQDDNRKSKKDKNETKKRDTLAHMKANAADFDLNSYILRKLISNQVVAIYTHLLSEYSVNAPRVNHRILDFLM